ncbi:Gfo/Idh/MocA family oxidoreductase [Acidaminobacter sp. JC074]|uniref:Gfo/Idh/MocA family protein n=1 Tax=Acidaminobacter sp. JC074 TaxID=2530199 RepID=UPI001F0EF07D|nr:Gfo/Idh/MocA family oxidoreductase [Acidaminobacter sp. JC074]MCH4887018.1 Gfo/Idh/MocA family oxidoreductase [Acidaminobacter sp. JC074]
MKVAIIGCGSISEVHVRSIEALGHDLKYVCDLDQEKASRFSLAYVRDYKSLFDKDIDVIHILTPHHLHVQMAIDCIEAGKHVLLEKPIGIEKEALKQLDEAIKSSNVKVGVIFQNRFNPCVKELKRIISTENLGCFKGSKSILAWNRDESYYQTDWKGRLSTEGGGLLINQAIHTFDLLRYLIGDYSKFRGMLSNLSHPDNDVEDTAMIEFDYNHGGRGIFMGTLNHKKNSSVEIELVFEKSTFRYMDGKLYRDSLIIMEDESTPHKDYYGCGHRDCIKNFYDHIERDENLVISFDDAKKTNEVILDIYKELS